MAQQNNLQGKTTLSRGQKLMGVFLVLVAIITFFFGIWQFKKSVKAPFERKVSSDSKKQTNESESDDIMALQNKDTDEDGLSDYEEIYIYQTSPYIADSDSDGIDDKKEIENGSDPNCQAGRDCGIVNPNAVDAANQQATGQEEEENENVQTDPFGLNGLNNISDLQNLVPTSPAEITDLNSILPDELPPSEIKELLKQAGMPENVLNQFTDEQLIKAYQETLKKMNTQ